HRDGIDPHRAIAGPGPLHISAPHRPAERCGKPSRGERNQNRNNPDARLVNGAHGRLHGADDAKASTLAALRFGFNIGHGKSQRAMTSTIDDSTIMYRAKMNSDGCQTWHSRSKRSAIRRNPMVANHAAIISNEIGAT